MEYGACIVCPLPPTHRLVDARAERHVELQLCGLVINVAFAAVDIGIATQLHKTTSLHSRGVRQGVRPDLDVSVIS